MYVLTSPSSEFIKIGGTDYPPLKRIKEINATEPYKSLGPWTLHDFRQVSDWRAVEHHLHYLFRESLVASVSNQKELFAINAVRASVALNELDPASIVWKPKVDRMFNDTGFAKFLATLLRFAGLLNWLDLQGAWTLSLFPSTSGGRYYTLNIGPHEVAYATLARGGESPIQMIHMDRLVRDFPEVHDWVVEHHGALSDEEYAHALERSTSVTFFGDFNVALEFLRLDGVRRAVIAYWAEALVRLQESGKTSVFERFHNWNAIAELKKRMDRNDL